MALTDQDKEYIKSLMDEKDQQGYRTNLGCGIGSLFIVLLIFLYIINCNVLELIENLVH
jgi:hypothetical protein